MDSKGDSYAGSLFVSFLYHTRRFLFHVLSTGPIPNHIAFILDGNRRYAKKQKLGEGMGHRAGFLALISLMKYCYELGVRYVTIYAFSIDNFKRRPEEVQGVMDLMLEKIEALLKEESIVNQHGVRVYFIGNLKLLNAPVRDAAEKAMKATENNNKSILIICMAYTSTDEIVHAAQEAIEEKWGETQEPRKASEIRQEKHEGHRTIKLADIERHIYMGLAPDPDILVRTSGESRLSNFLLWQTSTCLFVFPEALWPEIGLRHLVWAVLNYQRIHPYLEKRRKQV